MSKTITGVVTWLKGWFFDKDEITAKEQALQTQINNKASTSDLNTTNGNVSSLQTAVNNKTVVVEEQTTAETGFMKTYVVKQGGVQVGSKINIPKDFLVKSASVKSATLPNQPVAGLSVGAKYIDFVINSRDSSENDEHIYIKLSDILDYDYFDSLYAQKNHQSSSTNYGLGTTSMYGHVKIINSLTQSSNQNGLALSAYQGYVLKSLIDDLEDEIYDISSGDASNISYSPPASAWGEASQFATNVANALTYLMEECNLKTNKNNTVRDIQLVSKTDDNTGAIRLIYANE